MSFYQNSCFKIKTFYLSVLKVVVEFDSWADGTACARMMIDERSNEKNSMISKNTPIPVEVLDFNEDALFYHVFQRLWCEDEKWKEKQAHGR